MVREDVTGAAAVSTSPGEALSVSASPADPLALLKAFIADRNTNNGNYAFGCYYDSVC